VEHRGRERRRRAGGTVAFDQSAQGLRANEGAVAVEDEGVGGSGRCECLASLHDGVSRSQLFALCGEAHVAVAGKELAHELGAMSHNQHDR
jgi:hypothetical protein